MSTSANVTASRPHPSPLPKGEGIRVFLAFAVTACLLAGGSFAFAAGELTLTIVDPATNKPIPCRMHLRNDKDRPQRVAKTIAWDDHFVFPGTVKLKLPRGTYHYKIEHGPEYLKADGYFVMEDQSKDDKVFHLKRAYDMANEGWWSGDLHVHRPIKDAELLMRADDLHVASIVTWSEKKTEWARKPPPADTVKRFDGNRYYDLVAGESVGAGGTLLFLNLQKPLAASESPDSQLNLLSAAREQEAAWIDASRVTAWDLPLWLATGRVDSIELCDDQFCRTATHEDPTGRPRDERSGGPAGVGSWSHEIYYHVLNCGLRIPPTAGSGTGEAPNPLGYNRVYVWVDKENFTYDAWWKGLRLGRAVVTNGPLICPFANGRQPGHVFQAAEGEQITFEVGLNFATQEPISYFELVKDGRVAQSLRYDELAQTGRFPPLEFDASGWFLVRAVTDNEDTYRFATSAPWYVEIGEKRKPVSKDSAQFFLDWLDERRQAIEGSDRPESDQSKKMWTEAKEYWERLVAEGEE
ncbi:MAG TPA: CehA/McbA family metallohydrolase [Pirellulales bacterium]|nr:CehA/McbA family metallohydrolase [Pirellulales bacterium]